MIINKIERVVYVGRKPVKRDTICGTGIIWDGFGDVQEVEHKEAVKMIQHPDVWVLEEKFKTMNFQAENPTAGLGNPDGKQSKSEGGNPDDKKTGSDSDDDDDDSKKDENPAVSDSLKAVLVEMINNNNPDDFTEKNKPKLDVVKSKLGEDVTVKQLNAAWKEVSGS